MFGWIRAWFTERNATSRRSLFRYWDGGKWRAGDPFAIWRALANHPKLDLDTMAPMADAGKEPETTILIEAFCEVFDVQRWDEKAQTGLTDWEIMNLLVELQTYFSNLKKNTSPGPTSPAPTDSESSMSGEALGSAMNAS